MKNLLLLSVLLVTTLVSAQKQLKVATDKNEFSCDSTYYSDRYWYIDDIGFQFLSFACPQANAAKNRIVVRNPGNDRLGEVLQGASNTFLKTDSAGLIQWVPDISVSAGGGLSYNSATRVLSQTSAVVFLPNVTVSYSAGVALLAGVRKVTITGVTGLIASDRVMLTPVGSTPAGYALADAVATSAGTLEVSYTGPALAIGGSFSIPCKLTVFR